MCEIVLTELFKKYLLRAKTGVFTGKAEAYDIDFERLTISHQILAAILRCIGKNGFYVSHEAKEGLVMRKSLKMETSL